MLSALLFAVQFVACMVIFITGTLLLSDLPRGTGARWMLRKMAMALLSGGAAFASIRPVDPYLCAVLVGIAIWVVTDHEICWWRWAWKGFGHGQPCRVVDRRRVPRNTR